MAICAKAVIIYQRSHILHFVQGYLSVYSVATAAYNGTRNCYSYRYIHEFMRNMRFELHASLPTRKCKFVITVIRKS